MDFNKVFENAVNEAVNEKITTINDLLNKKFEKYDSNLVKVLDGIKAVIDADDAGQIFNFFNNFNKEIKAAVNGEELDIPFVNPKTKSIPKTQPKENRNVTEVIVDREGRIRIPKDVLDKIDLPLEGTVKILKDKKTNSIYITNESYYDHKKTFIKYRDLTDGAFRIGIANLLNVKEGDVVGIEVGEDYLVLSNTNTNNNIANNKNSKADLAERGAAAIEKLLNALGFKVSNIEEIANKQGPNFKLRAYKIKI